MLYQAGGGGASSRRGSGSGSGVTTHNDSNSPGEHTDSCQVKCELNITGAKSDGSMEKICKTIRVLCTALLCARLIGLRRDYEAR